MKKTTTYLLGFVSAFAVGLLIADTLPPVQIVSSTLTVTQNSLNNFDIEGTGVGAITGGNGISVSGNIVSVSNPIVVLNSNMVDVGTAILASNPVTGFAVYMSNGIIYGNGQFTNINISGGILQINGTNATAGQVLTAGAGGSVSFADSSGSGQISTNALPATYANWLLHQTNGGAPTVSLPASAVSSTTIPGGSVGFSGDYGPPCDAYQCISLTNGNFTSTNSSGLAYFVVTFAHPYLTAPTATCFIAPPVGTVTAGAGSYYANARSYFSGYGMSIICTKTGYTAICNGVSSLAANNQACCFVQIGGQ